MKRIFILMLLTTCSFVWAWGQYDDEQEAMYRNARLQHAAQNDGMYEYVMTGHYSDLYGPAKKVDMSQIERKIREQQRVQEQQRQQQAQQEKQNNQNGQRVKTIQSGGISFVTDNPVPRRSKSQSRTAQIKQQQKARDEARHRAWQEQRRRAAEEAARQEEIRRQREAERRRKEYERVRAEEAIKSQAIYEHHASQVDFQVNEGRDFMYNYRVQGTEIQESSYIPSTVSNEPVSVVPKSGYGGKSAITLTGNEKVTTQMEEWQYSADFERIKAIGRPISSCEDVIEVVPIGNGCGPAEGKVKQKLAKVGLYLDARRNVRKDPQKKSIVQEMARLENVCSDIHDPGYLIAQNKYQKLAVDAMLFFNGGHIMGIATAIGGKTSWQEAQEAAKQSEALSKEYTGEFDPSRQILRKVRKCGKDKF